MKQSFDSNPAGPVPYIFTLAKRFFRKNKIKYYNFPGRFSIVTRENAAGFPVLFFTFHGERVRVVPVPFNGWSLDVTVQSFEDVLHKVENHGFIFRPAEK